jgi:hypothetical protein
MFGLNFLKYGTSDLGLSMRLATVLKRNTSTSKISL